MLTTTTPLNRSLGNHLILKSLADAQDAERLIAFNNHIFGHGEAEMTRSLVFHHPATRPENWLYVEDETSRQIVSALVLIPWQWRYDDVTLKSGEMGIVGTHESYRNRGIIRAQVARFKELLHEDGYDLSHIQGIPYFYRQFGYEYALPLEPGWHIALDKLPAEPNQAAARYRFRPATLDDLPTLMRLYNEASDTLNMSTIRNEAIWRFQFEDAANTAIEGEYSVMLDASEQVVAYWRIMLEGFGNGLIVSETSHLSISAAEALLHHLKCIALERGKPNIRLNLPLSNDLLQAARYYGAQDSGTYAWQMHIVDVARLLYKLAPVLERRIAASPFRGFSEKVCINLYKDTIELDFQQGKLLEAKSIGFTDGGAIRIPPNVFTPLVLGYRSREELAYMYPDLSVWGQNRHLVDVLFPKVDAFFYANY